MEQPRVERVLRLMRLMSGNALFTVEDLARKLDTSYRSIYRYIDTFKTLGFAVEKMQGNVYRLVKLPPQFKDLTKLVYFSDEEANILCGLIENLDSTNTLKAALYKKLAAIYDLSSIKEFTGSKSNAACIQALRNAMDEKKQVVLKSYASSNSGDIRDRVVEPFAFTNNHIEVWAFDTADRKNKVFKIPRIEWVDVLSSDWKYAKKHHRGLIDAFHMCTDGEQMSIHLEMTLRAKNLLVEEFPLAATSVRRKGDKWIYDGLISKVEGAGRFCIGLAGDVKVFDSPELEAYIQDYVKQFIIAK